MLAGFHQQSLHLASLSIARLSQAIYVFFLILVASLIVLALGFFLRVRAGHQRRGDSNNHQYPHFAFPARDTEQSGREMGRRMAPIRTARRRLIGLN